MNDYIVKRVIDISQYIIDNKCTVRQAAAAFGVSKSTVHKDCSERVFELDRELYKKVRQVLEYNFDERHIRGGIATKQKYSQAKQ